MGWLPGVQPKMENSNFLIFFFESFPKGRVGTVILTSLPPTNSYISSVVRFQQAGKIPEDLDVPGTKKKQDWVFEVKLQISFDLDLIILQ